VAQGHVKFADRNGQVQQVEVDWATV